MSSVTDLPHGTEVAQIGVGPALAVYACPTCNPSCLWRYPITNAQLRGEASSRS